MWSEIGSGCFKGFDINACPATVVGVAIDGFPIYGPQKCTCVSFNADGSCSEWPTSPSTYFSSSDLDSCNGKAVDSSSPTQSSDVNAEHIYEYRLTADPPYHVGCIMGNTANCGNTRTRTRSRTRSERDESILTKALKEGAAEHLMELNEILEEAAREVEAEEREDEMRREEEEQKREEEEERKREEEEERARSVNKLRSLLEDLMNKQ